jgi:GGDEF domain-containing protein
VLASRALQGQLGRFLEAARRLGSGDFSSPVPIEGHDEFAALGEEFNSMSRQLARRLEELDEERARLRISIGRIGETFASNLDRRALLELALESTIDAVGADRGRLSSRRSEAESLSETKRIGSLADLENLIHEAERAALTGGGFGESAADDLNVASVALGAFGPHGRTHGLITVVRSGEPFTRDDRGLLRYLASQATLALENVELHFQVRRQAVTDDLTGLATHGRFQERLASEMEEVRRYLYPVAVIMLDIDDFKSVNDLHGHQQGDVVIRYVARALRESSREGRRRRPLPR